MPNVLSPRDLVSRPDRMDETVPHTHKVRIPTLRGSLPDLGVGTKLESFIILAQSRNRGQSKAKCIFFIFHYF